MAQPDGPYTKTMRDIAKVYEIAEHVLYDETTARLREYTEHAARTGRMLGIKLAQRRRAL